MSASAVSHRVSASCMHRLAGARAPMRWSEKRRACAPLPPRWRAQTAGLNVARPSATALADARRTTHQSPQMDRKLSSMPHDRGRARLSHR